MTSISNTTQNRSTEENKPCVLMGDVRTEHFTYLTKKQWLKNRRIQLSENFE